MAKNIVIIGGGIIGLTSAWYCTQRGHQVTVIDRNPKARDGCSFGNAGMIVPSHFVPLAAPGMIKLGLKWMWNPESPFYIRPRASWDLLAWLWRFRNACNASHVKRSAPVLRDLHLASRACFQELSSELDDSFLLTPNGLLMLCKSEQALSEEAETAQLANSLNVEACVLDAKATAEKGGLAGKKLESINVERLKTDYNTLRSTQSLEVADEAKQGEVDAIASGELNPYQKFYIDAAAGGAGVIMSLPPSTLSGIPELTEFPKEICQFTEAKQVVILKNKIASIPAEISKMTNLKKLNLSNNKLTALPAEIGTLGNLETLKLANNPLEILPAELSNCKNLKSLVLKGTKIPADQIKELQAKLPNCKIKI